MERWWIDPEVSLIYIYIYIYCAGDIVEKNGIGWACGAYG